MYTLANKMYAPLLLLLNQSLAFQKAKVSYERTEEYCAQREDKEYTGTKPFNMEKNLVISGISFGYSVISVLNNLCLEFAVGRIYAITGKSGIGKTTIIKLLARLLFPDDGKVYVDGVNATEIDYIEYRRNVLYMPQQAVIFDSSLRDNITLGLEFADSDVYTSLEMVGMSDFVTSLSNGIDSFIGIRYRDISEGEKQRICLARTIIRKPKIILLDEPTSHLDEISTQTIYNCLNKYRISQNATIIIVTHTLKGDFADEWIRLK